ETPFIQSNLAPVKERLPNLFSANLLFSAALPFNIFLVKSIIEASCWFPSLVRFASCRLLGVSSTELPFVLPERGNSRDRLTPVPFFICYFVRRIDRATKRGQQAGEFLKIQNCQWPLPVGADDQDVCALEPAIDLGKAIAARLALQAPSPVRRSDLNV